MDATVAEVMRKRDEKQRAGVALRASARPGLFRFVPDENPYERRSCGPARRYAAEPFAEQLGPPLAHLIPARRGDHLVPFRSRGIG
jgi:hypothetical protein